MGLLFPVKTFCGRPLCIFGKLTSDGALNCKDLCEQGPETQSTLVVVSSNFQNASWIKKLLGSSMLSGLNKLIVIETSATLCVGSPYVFSVKNYEFENKN